MRTRLRQIVVVAGDLDAVEAEATRALGVEVCYRDPGVAVFGLRNALFPVGDQFLEIVSPTEPGTAAGRLLDKRGGDAGYMVMIEVDDLAAARRLVVGAGARIVYQADGGSIVGLHLHPADVGGAILSVDQCETWGEWPWAGTSWRDHIRTERVDGVLGVEIAAADPTAMAERWAAVLGCDVESEVTPTLHLDDGQVRFVPSGAGHEGVHGFELSAPPGSAPIDVEIAGCRFRSVPTY